MVLLITDGNSQDEVGEISRKLRDDGVEVGKFLICLMLRIGKTFGKLFTYIICKYLLEGVGVEVGFKTILLVTEISYLVYTNGWGNF